MSKKIDQDTRDIILTNLGTSLTIFLFGFLAAYLFRKNAVEYKNLIFWFTVLIFLIVAVVVFFKKAKKQKELYEKRRKQIEESNKNTNKEE